jgi:DNA-binding MarR family transcriptional regulator
VNFDTDRAFNISRTEEIVLQVLRRSAGDERVVTISGREIADQTFFSVGHVHNVAQSLERKGYIESYPDAPRPTLYRICTDEQIRANQALAKKRLARILDGV